MNIPVILGTAREGRQSENVANFLHELITGHDDVESIIVDPRDYASPATIPAWEESDVMKPWRDIVTKADGFVLVLPEYNHSFSGELKILLDGAYKEYEGKPISLCGVSAGGLGGTRVVESIKPVLNSFGLVITKGALYFSGVEDLFKDGVIDEKEKEAYTKKFESLLEELFTYVNKLK